MRDFALFFIPLFFALDVVGLLPIYIGLTVGMSVEQKRRVVRAACITGISIAAGFVFLGDSIFRVLNVRQADFRMAGGLLLLVFAIQDLYSGGKPRRNTSPTMAIVPLGMPLIVGPGVLTTCLLLVQQHGYSATLGALVANLLIVFIVLRFSDRILTLITQAGATAVAKVASLFLAAIGISMLRAGIEETVRRFAEGP